MSIPVLAVVTDSGRQHFADMLVNGRSFDIVSFVIGNGGADPSNPTVALTPDPSAVVLPAQFFGPKLIADTGFLSTTCPYFDCTLLQLDAVGSISNIGLIAQVNFSPIVNDPELNTTFLFAIGNFPLRVKTDSETITFRISIQF